jgi:hypothetical protein
MMLASVDAAAETLAHVPSLAHVGEGGLSHATLAALLGSIEHWHEFYLLAGTGAVTLVGLLFVALSFHLDTLLHESKAHLLGAARMAFTSFVYVLMLSLAFLAPDMSPRLLGVFLFILSAFLLGHAVWVTVAHQRKRDRDVNDRFLRRRYMATGLIAAIAITSAVRFLQQPDVKWFYSFALVVALMLINATTTSWDLLVQVGRLKLAQERRPHP